MNFPRIRDLPEEERGPFTEELAGQTRPWVEGVPKEDQDFYYSWDYEKWKAGISHHPLIWD